MHILAGTGKGEEGSMHRSDRIVDTGPGVGSIAFVWAPEVCAGICGELDPTADGRETLAGKQGLFVSNCDRHVSSFVGAMAL